MTDFELILDVLGIPVPQGGLTAYARGGRAILTHKRRPELLAWRAAIASTAAHVLDGRSPFEGPLSVTAHFRIQRPKAHYLPANRSRPAPVLRLDAPEFAPTTPDLDKLARAALDALTGVVFRDDAQVVRLVADKRYDERPGVEIVIRTVNA